MHGRSRSRDRSRGHGTLPFTPASLSNLKLWLVSDRSITLTSGNVSTWGDLSGLGHSPTDGGSATRRPAPIAAGLNGRQTIRFNGTSNYLSATFTSVQPQDVFIVLKIITYGALNNNDAVFDGATSLSNFYGASTTAADSTFIYAGSPLASTTRLADGTFEQAEMVYNGGSSAIYHGSSGAQLASGATGANNAGGFTIGAEPLGSRFTNIEVAEIISYSSVKTAGERALVRQYLTQQWGV